jgi:NitT/TauT family transport system substrate-binding protein
MSMRFRLGTVAALMAAVLTVAACGSDDSSSGSSSGSAASTSSSSADGGGSKPISLALTASSGAVCTKLTDERGLFKKNGVTIKYVQAAPTGAAQIAQILNGQLDAGAGAYTGVITAASNNLPVVITNAQDEDYSQDGQTAFATVVGKKSGITSFKQLEGKSVAVNSLKGNWEVSLKEAVAQDGGDPSKVKLVAIPFPDQVTALKSGRVDAISTLQPFIANLTSQGFKSIGDPQAIGFGGKQDSVVDVMFVGKKFAQEHDKELKGFIAAMQEGNAWCNAHPDEVRKEIVSFTKADPKVVAATPVPKFTEKLGPTTTDDWSKLLVKYGIIKQAPPKDQVQWSGAPE